MYVKRAGLATAVTAAFGSFLVACGGGGGGTAIETPVLPPISSVCIPAVATGFAGNIETRLPTTGSEVAAGAGGGGDGGGGAAAGGGLGKVLGGLLRVTDLSNGTVVGEAITDATSGLVTVKTCSRTGPFLLTMEGRAGAQYFDEGLERLVDFGPGNSLHALVDVWDEHVGVSPLTEAAYKYALNNFKLNPLDVASGKAALAQTGELQGLTAAQVVAANNLVRDQINARNISGFDLLSSKSLPLPLDAGSSTNSLSRTRYGKAASVNGGLVKATAFYSEVGSPALTFARNLSRDMTDGNINGFALDGSAASQPGDIAYDSVRLPVASMIGINAMSQRFSVDQLTTAPLTLDEYAHLFGVGTWTGLCHFMEYAGLMSNGTVSVRRDDKGGVPGASCSFNPNAGVLIPNYLADVKLLVGTVGVSYAVKKSGEVYAWGNSRFGSMPGVPEGVYRTPQLIGGVSKITSLTAGGGNTNDPAGGVLARDEKGQVFQWGRSSSGAETSTPIARVSGLTDIVKVFSKFGNYFALDSLGRLYAWGDGTAGLLANATPATPLGSSGLLQGAAIATPTAIPGLGKVRDLTFVHDTAFALLADGTVYAWGGDSRGLLGRGVRKTTFIPTRVPDLSGVSDINGGAFTGLDVILSNGKLIAWNPRLTEVAGALPIRKIMNINDLGGLYLLRDGRAVREFGSGASDATTTFR